MHPQHLTGVVLKALKDRNDIDTAEVDDIVWGSSAPMRLQGGAMGRMAALDVGYDIRASGIQVSRYCGSGLSAAAIAAAQIRSGMEDLIIAGGTEMMSFVNDQVAQEMAAGFEPLDGAVNNQRLMARHPHSHQGVCADAIACMERIPREALDALALESQKRAAQALADGRFERSTVPVVGEDGTVILDREQYPRPQTTAADLAALPPAFAQMADLAMTAGGPTFRELINRRYPDVAIEARHHAGNSSGVVDGSAGLLLASEDYARRHGLKPRARVVATANVGDCPTLMLNAPVPAARKVLQKAGLSLEDIDLWEVNEAFAVVIEKFVRDLVLDRDKINVNGGAIALGHPIGATGAILIGALLDELERRDLKRGVATMCAAGGMAPAIVIERV
jgi:acetyl-CoA C-acetyltransferase